MSDIDRPAERLEFWLPAPSSHGGRDYATKTRSNMDQLTDLLTRLAGSVDSSRAQAVRDLQDRFGQGRLRVLLVGEAKRGKSTLGNAILRRQVLPVGVVPLTAVTTTVRPGTPEHVDVQCLNGHLITAPIADLTLYVTEAGNPRNERGIDQVVVYLDSPLPHPSMELVDTPGVGSIHQHNTEVAENALGTMDVAVFVLTMDPPISAAEVALLARVRNLAARVYVVLNKIDQLEPADRGAAERFTRQVIADVLRTEPGDVALFPVSARAAIRATDAGDADGWAVSGMAGFTRTLRQHLDSSWRTDLTVSIAGGARRLVTELLDEATLTRRARDLLAAQQAHKVAAFGERLDDLLARRDDAAAAADAHLARWRSTLDEDAATVIAPLAGVVCRDLDARLDALKAPSAADLETAGWSAMTNLVTGVVDPWRENWSTRLTQAATEAARRQQTILDEAIADIRAAAAELLGIDLASTAPILTLPETGKFRFDVTAEIGWNQPLTAVLRRRVPGAAGRNKMRRYLRAEAAGMVDKHIGRARADFQARLARLALDLHNAADHAYGQRQTQLRAALDIAGRGHTEQGDTGPSDAAVRHWRELAKQLDQLLTSSPGS